MGYKQANWSNYGKNNADSIEVTIRDPTKKKVDFLRAQNNKDFHTVLGILRKYGFYADKPKGNKEKEKLKKEPDFLDPDFKWLKEQ